MTMTTQQRYEAARRLCAVVTGDEYGVDYERVTGLGVGIAEPGYGDKDTVWALGDWNDKTDYSSGERVVTDNSMSRLSEALDRIGVECHWLDEWYECQGCYQIVRSQSDSYHWQPSYADVDGELLCVQCATGDYLDELLEAFIGEQRKVLSSALVSEQDLLDAGFSRFNVPPAENGWHPGQDETPAGVLAAFESVHGSDCEWLFFMDEVSQFYVRFTLFYRQEV